MREAPAATARVAGVGEPVASIPQLEELARRVRVEVVRAVGRAGGGHLGASLSAAEVLVALYFMELAVRPEEPLWDGRDRFVLSKGHAALALYATQALRGYFPLDELATFGHIDSRLQGHPDMTRLPSVDMSSGALGVGFSAAVGIALGNRLRGSTARTWTMLGDGECQEGEVWEAAFIAARYGLDNLVAIVDLNGFQVTGWPGTRPGTRLPPWPAGPLGRQWAASGWRVLTMDGHDMATVVQTLAGTRRLRGRPTVIISRTVKGHGVSFLRGVHSRPLTDAELALALEELGEAG
jgi:transketolase